MNDEQQAVQEESDASEPNAKTDASQMPPADLDPKQTHVTHQWKYTSPLIDCCFDPQGRYVFSSAEDNSVQRWGFPNGELTKMEGHESWVRAIRCLPGGDTVVTVGSDEEMLFWPVDAEQPQPIRRVKAHQGWIRCLDVSPDGTSIVTGGNDHRVKLWNASDGALWKELTGHESHVYSVMFHPNGESVLSGDLSGQVKQWDVASGSLMHSFDAAPLHSYNKGQQVHYGGVRSLALSPDGKHLACGGLHKASNPLGAINEPLVLLFDFESQKLLRSLITESVRGVVWKSLFLPDGTLLAASGGSGGGFLVFWDPEQEMAFHKFKLKDTIRGLDLHPDRLHVATTHWDKHLRISRMTPKEPA